MKKKKNILLHNQKGQLNSVHYCLVMLGPYNNNILEMKIRIMRLTFHSKSASYT